VPRRKPGQPDRTSQRGYGHPSLSAEERSQRCAEAGLARVKQKKGHLWTPTEAKAWSLRAYLRSLLRGRVFGKPVKPLLVPGVEPPAEDWNEAEDEVGEV